MTKRIALLDESETVVNVLEFADDWEPEPFWNNRSTMVLNDDDRVSPGWKREQNQWVKPVEIPPVAPVINNDHLDPQIGAPDA